MSPASAEKHITIHTDTGALLGSFLGEVQKLLDVVTLAFTGLEAATESQYDGTLAFFSFHPAADRRQPFPDVKRNCSQWLLSSFLSDSVDAAGMFLVECWEVCSFYRLSTRDVVFGADYLAVRGSGKKEFHSLGFPDKLKCLAEEFQVETPLGRHFLTMNKARNCLVHRNGVVAKRDCNDVDVLTVEWRSL